MNTFEALGLSKGLAESVEALGFEVPTPIQEKAIPVLLQGNRDFVGLAQTGTGKTAAFGLPLLDLVDDKLKDTQALVLAPTRELGLQIANDLEKFSEKFKRFNIVAVYGGSSIVDQIRKIKKGAQIIVATPGRLIDLIGRKAINLSTIRFVVLDEADEMLNMGFKEDLDEILQHTPATKSTWLFSATMPREVKSISKSYMNDPFELTVGEQNKGNANIDHQYVLISEKDKYLALKRILDYTPEIFGLIFCRTRIDTQRIAEMLMQDGYNADSLHGDLTQQQRDRVMVKFRSRSLQILVATDVAARGIDVDDITHVIHLNLPDELEFYTHRSGRTARAGKKGISIALISRRELSKVKQIERSLKAPFTRMMIPTGPEVCQKQLLALMHKVRDVKVNEEDIEAFLPLVYDDLKDLTKQELIKRFASLEFNRFLDYYKNAADLNSEESGRSREGAAHSGLANGDRFFINVGKMDGLDKSTILELIDDNSGVGKKFIGDIELKGAYSFFEVDKSKSQEILNGFDKVEFKGRAVRVEITQERSEGRSSSRRSSSGGGSGRSFGGGGGSGRSYGGGSGGSYGGGSSYSGNRDRGTDRDSGSSSGSGNSGSGRRDYKGPRSSGSGSTGGSGSSDRRSSDRPRRFGK